MLHEQGRDQLDEAALVGDRGIAARQLLHHHGIGQRVEARPAHLLGHADAEEAEPGHPLEDLGGKALLAVERLRRGANHVVGEGAGHVPDLVVQFGEIHARSPPEVRIRNQSVTL